MVEDLGAFSWEGGGWGLEGTDLNKSAENNSLGFNI